MGYMQTYFDNLDVDFIAGLAVHHNPDQLADAARCTRRDWPDMQTERALASIRARGNWMQVNGHWYRKG